MSCDTDTGVDHYVYADPELDKEQEDKNPEVDVNGETNVGRETMPKKNSVVDTTTTTTTSCSEMSTSTSQDFPRRVRPVNNTANIA